MYSTYVSLGSAGLGLLTWNLEVIPGTNVLNVSDGFSPTDLVNVVLQFFLNSEANVIC